jgi:hypothetical protein
MSRLEQHTKPGRSETSRRTPPRHSPLPSGRGRSAAPIRWCSTRSLETSLPSGARIPLDPHPDSVSHRRRVGGGREDCGRVPGRGDLSDAREHVRTEKGHGREETRTYLQLPAPERLPGLLQWRGLKSIGLATSRYLRDGKETVEVRYDISSLDVDASGSPARFGAIGGRSWSVDRMRRSDRPKPTRINRLRHLGPRRLVTDAQRMP